MGSKLQRLGEKAGALTYLLRVNTGAGIRVLCYHTVVEQWRNKSVQWPTAVTFSAFRSHLAHLRENYQVIPVSMIQEVLQGPAKEWDRFACITFDDGYLSNYELAWPLLQEYRMPATIYLSTGYIETTRLMPSSVLRLAIAHKGPARDRSGRAAMESGQSGRARGYRRAVGSSSAVQLSCGTATACCGT